METETETTTVEVTLTGLTPTLPGHYRLSEDWETQPDVTLQTANTNGTVRANLSTRFGTVSAHIGRSATVDVTDLPSGGTAVALGGDAGGRVVLFLQDAAHAVAFANALLAATHPDRVTRA